MLFEHAAAACGIRSLAAASRLVGRSSDINKSIMILVVKLVYFSVVVHVLRGLAQKIAPGLKLVFYEQLVCNSIEQMFTQHNFCDHLFSEEVDKF